MAGEQAVAREVDRWWEAGLRAGMESSRKEKSRCRGEDSRASHIAQRRERCVGAFGVMVASITFLFGNSCDPWFDSPHVLFLWFQSRACLISINALPFG